jgi:Flp pilus assembly protein TadG
MAFANRPRTDYETGGGQLIGPRLVSREEGTGWRYWGCRRMQGLADDRHTPGGRAAKRAWRLRRPVIRLWRDQAGASLVEFSLIALPVFILLYGSFDLGFVYWANQELEHAASYGARLVRTGQVKAGAMDQVAFTAQVCSKTAVLFSCTTRLRLDVRSGATLGAITPPDPLNGSGKLKDAAEFAYSPGAANDVILVSAFFDWPPLLKPSDWILRAASVARNEPF